MEKGMVDMIIVSIITVQSTNMQMSSVQKNVQHKKQILIIEIHAQFLIIILHFDDEFFHTEDNLK